MSNYVYQLVQRQCTNLCFLAPYKLPGLGVVPFKESAHKIAVFFNLYVIVFGQFMYKLHVYLCICQVTTYVDIMP